MRCDPPDGRIGYATPRTTPWRLLTSSNDSSPSSGPTAGRRTPWVSTGGTCACSASGGPASRLGSTWGRPGVDLGALTHEAIAEFLTSDEALLRPDGEPKAATTSNALRSSVRGFFGYLERSGQLASNPARVVRMARVPENPPEPLKPAEVERLIVPARGPPQVG